MQLTLVQGFCVDRAHAAMPQDSRSLCDSGLAGLFLHQA